MTGKKEAKGEKEPPQQAEAPQGAGGATAKPEPPAEAKLEQQEPNDRDALLKRNEELLARLMYLQADYENLQKRTSREKREIILNAQETVLRSLLPILDDLDKGVEVAGEGNEGFGLLRAKLMKILEENGLREIPAKGQKFDPFLHDAAEYAEDGALEEGTIKDVIRKGYRCNLRVLRPSLVVVVKNEGEKNA